MAEVFGPLWGLAAKGPIGGTLWFGCAGDKQVIRMPKKRHGNKQQEKEYQEKHNPAFSEQKVTFKAAAYEWEILDGDQQEQWGWFSGYFESVDRCKMMSWLLNAKEIFTSFYLVCSKSGIAFPAVPADITREMMDVWEETQEQNYIRKGRWVDKTCSYEQMALSV